MKIQTSLYQLIVRYPQQVRVAAVGLAVLLFIILSLMMFNSVSATVNTNLLPDGTTSNTWAVGNHTSVDEYPSLTSDAISTGTSGDTGEVAQLSVENLANVNSATSLTLNYCAVSLTGPTPNGGTFDDVTALLRINGVDQSGNTVTPPYNATATNCTWYQVNYTGSWNSTAVDSIEMKFTRTKQGSGQPASQDDNVAIVSAYVAVTYTAESYFEQSAYRWFNNSDSSAPTTFAQSLGTSSSDTYYDMTPTADGGYIATGNTLAYNSSSDLLLTKFNGVGDEEWSVTVGDTGDDTGRSVIETSTGHFVVVGDTASYGSTADDIWILKFDRDGNEVWTYTLGDTGDDNGYDVVEDSSGDYILVGNSSSSVYSGGSYDMLIAKFNSSGVEQWTSTQGGTGADAARGVIEVQGGGYVLIGDADSSGWSDGEDDIIISKYNTSGVEQWTTSIGGTSDDNGYDIAEDSNGDLYFTGSSEDGNSNLDYDLIVGEVNSSGVEQWTKTFWKGTQHEAGDAIAITDDGGFVVAGYNPAVGQGADDMWLTKFSSTGVPAWSYTYGSTGADAAYAVWPAGNGYIMAGKTNYGQGSGDTWLVKTDSSGQIASCASTVCESQTPLSTATKNLEDVRTVSSTARGDYSAVQTSNTTVTDRTGSLTAASQGGSEPAINVGTTLNGVAQNTATTAPNGPFRLRMLLHITEDDLVVGAADLKLQYAKKVGTCDTSFTGEVYADVTSTSGIAYYDNTNADDSIGLTANANDPTHSGHTVTAVNYQEANNISNTVTVANGNDGLWDFALTVTDNADPDTAYCLRLIYGDDTALDTYTVIPEITTPSVDFDQSGYRWFENEDATTNTFIQTLGGSDVDYGGAVTIDASDNYVVASQTQSVGAGGYDALIVKYDSTGHVQWSKTWGGTGTELPEAVVSDSAGDYVVAGYTTSYGAGGDDVFIAKFNNSGVEQWSKTWGDTGSERANSITVDAGGNYIVVGETNSYGAGGDDVFIAKFNSSGVEQWSKTWGDSSTDYAKDVTVDASGDYIVTGTTNSYGAGGWDMFIAKFNSSGVEQWSKTWGDTNSDLSSSITTDGTGSYIVAGSTENYGAGLFDTFIAKFNSNGVEQWSKTWGTNGNDTTAEVAVDNSGNYIIVGVTQVGFQAFITSFDTSGVEQWSKTWGGSSVEAASGITIDSAGNYIVTGDTQTYTSDSRDMFVAKFAAGSGDITNCAICESEDITEGNITITEGNVSITESNVSITEADQSITEASQSLVANIICGDSSFVKIWGNSTDSESGEDLFIDKSGDYVITGSSSNPGGADMAITRVSSTGAKDWNKTWGSTSSDLGRAITEGAFGSYIVVGDTSSYGAGSTDVFITRFSKLGAEAWSKTWGNSSHNYVKDVTTDGSGNIIFSGYTTTASSDDVFIVKLNSSGVAQWSKSWGDPNNDDQAYSITTDAGGNYIVVGQTNSYGAGTTDMFITKFNSSGVEQWSKTWGGTSVDGGRSVTTDADGNYIVTGYTSNYGAGGFDMFITKFNSSGVEQWSKTWGGTGDEYAEDVTVDESGNYIITGSTDSYGAGNDDMFITKFNSSGVEQWSKTWGGTGNESGDGVQVDLAGNYVLSGNTTSFGEGWTDMVIAKFPSSGKDIDNCSSCQDQSITEGDITLTEGDVTLTEGNLGISDSTQTVTEADETVVEGTVCSFSLLPENVSIGSPYAAQNTAASLVNRSSPLRLRFLLDANRRASVGDVSLKLQVATRVGTCDVNFVGESYSDVSGSAAFDYHNNTNIANQQVINSVANDPTDGNTIVAQNYIESAPLTNNRSIDSTGESGLWDAALSISGSAAAGTYCFRVVQSDGSPFTVYTQIPEITIPAVFTGPTLEQSTRGGGGVINGIKQVFSW